MRTTEELIRYFRELLSTPEGRAALREQATRGLRAGLKLRRNHPEARAMVQVWITQLRLVRDHEDRP